MYEYDPYIANSEGTADTGGQRCDVAIRLKIGKTTLYDALRETDQEPQQS